MTKTTKEIYQFVKKGIESKSVLEDIEIASHSKDLWYSQSEVDNLRCEILKSKREEEYNTLEQLRKELKEELRCNLPSNFDCDKESQLIVDNVFNKFSQSSPSKNLNLDNSDSKEGRDTLKR